MRRNEEICFNRSHSGKYVLFAVSEMEIGCDIEKIKEVKWKLAKRFFSEKEYDFLVRLGRQEKLMKQGETVKSGKTDKQEKVGKQQNINRQKEKGKIKENAYTCLLYTSTYDYKPGNKPESYYCWNRNRSRRRIFWAGSCTWKLCL